MSLGLSNALNIAKSALAASSVQSSVLSQNIANASNSDYSLRTVNTVSGVMGSVTTSNVQRSTNTALLANLLAANGASSAQSALNDGLTSLANTLNLDNTSSTSSTQATDTSPATLIGTLNNALQAYAAQPDSESLAQAAVSAAKAVATNLNSAAANVQSVRAQADSDMAASVATINSLLTQFTAANNSVVKGTAEGTDVSDAQDQRDSILKQLSQQIGVTTSVSSTGSMSIYTDSGATLFETTPRAVKFTPTNNYTSSTVGSPVTVDGVPVTGSTSVMPITSGALAGYATLRDSTSVAYGNQLDQIASSLVSTFSETSSSGSGQVAGLFQNAGSTTIPTSATGVAATISVASSVDVSTGGNAELLRDGNISGLSTTANTTGAASYADRLNALLSGLNATQSFDSTTGGIASGSIATYAASSVSWISAQQQQTSSASNTASSVASAATTALSNATGVNLDDQMSQMLDIEHAYQASAQLMNTVNSMYSSLLAAFN